MDDSRSDAEGDPAWGLAPDLEEPAVELFATLLALPAEQRANALEQACGGNARLRTAVEELLRDHDHPPPILDKMLQRAQHRPEPEVGIDTMIGPYRVLEAIGRGGMGVVYRAMQVKPRRTVALKVMSLNGGSAEAVRRFEREVEVLGLLQHPGICRIYGAGAVDLGIGLGETPYFAMELIDGTPLTGFAREHELDIAARCELVAQVCDAVQHAHEHDVVHRDLKPANILVTGSVSEAPVARVLDFGIARAIQRDSSSPGLDTRTGMLLGTLHYMSPEQLGGSVRNIDARSDVYSLGAILYELLTSRLPLQLEDLSLTEVCRTVAQREPTPLGKIDRRLRGDLSTIAGKALQKDREDRYQSAAELADDLRRYARREPIRARPQTATYQLRRFAQRNRALVGGIAATMLLLIAGVIAFATLASHNNALAISERQAREQLRGSLYRSQMRLGSSALQQPGGVARVRQILDDWLPAPDSPDLRGFEWHLLHAAANQEVRVLPSGEAPQSLQWLTDGQRLLAIHPDTAVLGDATTGRVLRRFDAALSPIAVASASADGSLLVQAVNGKVLRAIDTATGTEVATFTHERNIGACQVSPDGNLLAVATDPQGIVIWNPRTGRRLAELDERASSGLAFSRGGDLFAAGLMQPVEIHARVWHTADWSRPPLELRVGNPEHANHLHFSADGRHLAIASHEGKLRIWNTDSGALEHEFAHADNLRGCAFDPTGRRIAVACRDYATYVYDLQSGDQQALCGHTGIVSDVAWSPSGELLATIGDDQCIRIWDPRTPPVVRSLTLPRMNPVESGQLSWTPDSRQLAVLCSHGSTATWDLDTDAVDGTFRIAAHGRSFRWTQSDRRLEAGDGRETQPLTLPTCIPDLAFLATSRDGRRLAIAGEKGAIWTSRDDGFTRISQQPNIDVRGIGWNAAGRIVTIDSRDAIRVLDANTGAERTVRTIPECTLCIAVSPDGETIAVGCVDQAIRLLSANATGAITVLRGHTSHVQAVAFSADGKRLASGGRDQSVRVWDVSAATEVTALPTEGHVIAVAWSPDGLALACLNSVGRVQVWDAHAAPKRPR